MTDKFRNILVLIVLFSSICCFIFAILDKNADAQTGWFVAICMSFNCIKFKCDKNDGKRT